MVRHPRFVFLYFAIISTLITGCRTLHLPATAVPADLTLDGDDHEWSSSQCVLLGEKVLTGVSNDSKFLYLTFTVTDPGLLRMVMMSRLELALISGDNSDQYVTLRFPFMEYSEGDAPGDIVNPDDDPPLLAWDVQATGFPERRRYFSGELTEWGVGVAMTHVSERLICELMIPLTVCTGETWRDIDLNSGILWQLKTGSYMAVKPGRGGPCGGPSGGGSRGGRGSGNMSGGPSWGKAGSDPPGGMPGGGSSGDRNRSSRDDHHSRHGHEPVSLDIHGKLDLH
ncbi:MAG TPA: hypothetical protein PLV45_01310 [bacterium]|nr:hypothetical protein [bacterium]